MQAFLIPEVAIAAASVFFVTITAIVLIMSYYYRKRQAAMLQAFTASGDALNEQKRCLEKTVNQQVNDFNLQQQKLAYLQQTLLDEQRDRNSEKVTMVLEIKQQQDLLNQSQLKIGRLQEQANELVRQHDINIQTKHDLALLQKQLSELQVIYESQKASFEQERLNFTEKLSILENAEKHLSVQFENLANKIFEQKSEKFTKTSESGLTSVIAPLKQQIDDFKRQINDQYNKEGQERASLKTEILSLQALNKQITEEAAALTNALKGDNKQQGNWGELVLERILNESGLRKGHEYETQKSLTDDAGKRYQPDVVVHLPNDKDIVIDSKVSLTAYERYVNAANESDAKKAIKEHTSSIRMHIKGLSKKDYQDLTGVRTLDYVLMFIPIESAFIAAIEEDQGLIKYAMDNQIMLVSPTNLLVALRTINNIWQYEYQNQNANKIAEHGRKMYDKLVGFVADLDKVGKSLDNATKNYDSALSKLSTGRGNLIRQAEMFKKLGVSPTKSFDTKLIQLDEDSD